MRKLLAVFVCSALVLHAQGNSWDKVRYNGGTLQTKVDPKDWDNRLTVTSDKITLQLKDKQTLEIPTPSVTGLSYGQEAHRRVGTMVALGILVAPVALFGLFHKTRLHFIGIEYKTADGKGAGVLLQGHKDNYRAILMALRGATGARVAVSEKDREFVPTGVEAKVVKESEGEKTAESKETSARPKDAATGTIAVSSTPDGAEISVDGAFMGNAPATLKLPPGKHVVRVALSGYKEWTREITVLAGSELKLAAALEKQN